MAKPERLNAFNDLGYIDEIAARYGKDPDEVYNKSFDWVASFRIMWKEQREFSDRCESARSTLFSENETK